MSSVAGARAVKYNLVIIAKRIITRIINTLFVGNATIRITNKVTWSDIILKIRTTRPSAITSS
jgi:hypothetical protein